jgi:hypothetical protein
VESAAVAGVVENYQERVFKRGGSGNVASFELEDAHGRVKAKLRGDRIDEFGHLLKGVDPLLVRGKVGVPMSDECFFRARFRAGGAPSRIATRSFAWTSAVTSTDC